MNNQLIEKVISNDSITCPEFTYENPVLDPTVAAALSKSFVKILSVSQQNSNINNNLRHSVLANIRKMCRTTPENHLEIGDTVTNLLTKVYIEEVNNPHASINPVEKSLDNFIVRSLKNLDVSSKYPSSLTPEVAQSLINLNESSMEPISQNILNLNVGKNLTLVKYLWNRTNSESFTMNVDDIAIRMKPEIEKNLLNTCHSLLIKPTVILEELFCSLDLKDLTHKCSISPECFQICSGILDSLFVNVNYNSIIQLFISEFVRNVKDKCSETISVLYPASISYIVVLLDIDLQMLPESIKSMYIHNTLPYLKELHSKSEADFILLLSHYPQWFDIYFDQ